MKLLHKAISLCFSAGAALAAQESLPPITPFVLETSQKHEGFGLRAKWETRYLTYLFARNSGGVTVSATEEPMFPGQGFVKRAIWSPDGVTRAVIDISVKSVRTMLDETMVDALRDSVTKPPKTISACLRGFESEKVVGEAMMGGVRVFRVQGGNKWETHERFVWVEGGCIDLGATFMWKDMQGKDLTRVTTTLKSLKIGEPPASLFVVPAEYTEESETEGLTKLYALIPKDKVPQGFYENKLKGDEYKRYMKYGPYPGGAAEKLVKERKWQQPVLNPEVLSFRK